MAISEKLTKVNDEVVLQEDLLMQIKTALDGKEAGGDSGGIDTSDATAEAHHILAPETAYVNGVKVIGTLETQEKEVTPTTETQEVVPDDGKLLSKVTVFGNTNLEETSSGYYYSTSGEDNSITFIVAREDLPSHFIIAATQYSGSDGNEILTIIGNTNKVYELYELSMRTSTGEWFDMNVNWSDCSIQKGKMGTIDVVYMTLPIDYADYYYTYILPTDANYSVISVYE